MSHVPQDPGWIRWIGGLEEGVRDRLRFVPRDGAELWVLSVASPPEIADDVETEAVIENSRRYHQRLLADLKAGAAKARIKTHFEVAVGHPAEDRKSVV